MDFLTELLQPFQWGFMRNALLAVLVISPLFGLLSTMVVTSRMSFFSDALGHSAFTGIAIGTLCGLADPLWMAVLLAAAIAVPLVTDRSFAPLAAAAGYGLAVWYGFRQLDGMNGDISGFALTLGELAGAAVWTLVR